MTAIRRMESLEQQAGTILLNMGYDPMIVTDLVRNSRYIPYNLTARRELDDGTIDNVMVKLKVSLHPIRSPEEAAFFCREEMGRMKKFFAQAPAGMKVSRFEVWVSIPSDRFQQFEIRRDGIREILSPDQNAGQAGGVA